MSLGQRSHTQSLKRDICTEPSGSPFLHTALTSALHSCPWLYDQFVGMYQTDEEIATRIEAVEGGSWAGQLLQHIVSQQAG